MPLKVEISQSALYPNHSSCAPSSNSYPQIGSENVRPSHNSIGGQVQTDKNEDGLMHSDVVRDGFPRRKVFEDDQAGEEVLTGNYGPAYCYVCNVM